MDMLEMGDKRPKRGGGKRMENVAGVDGRKVRRRLNDPKRT